MAASQHGVLDLRKLIFGILAVTAASLSFADIRVLVNNDEVMFNAAGPQKIGSRVLVPLRGVLEKLGAQVDWTPSTRTVSASTSNTEIQMVVGENRAKVNGRWQDLDSPAQIYRGTTLVPLRFMASALGADVQWDNAAQTVFITTGTGGGTTTPPPTGETAVTIGSFVMSPTSGWIGANKPVVFTVVGTPGAMVTVDAGTITAGKPFELRETTAGRYVGTWISDTRVISAKQRVKATLTKGSSSTNLQMASFLTVDTLAPRFKNWTPIVTTESRPEISVVFDDAGGSQVDPTKVLVYWGNDNVTNEAKVTQNFMTFKPSKTQGNGKYTVRVVAVDGAGNRSEKSWDVTIR
jgi:hypothetical protein